jgi:hypothetical protein
MKRILPFLLLTIFITNKTQAQLAEKNSMAIQIGYGYPSVMTILGQMLKFSVTTADESASSSFSYKGFGPLHFRAEYMLGGRVGLGLSSNFETGKFTFENNYTDFDENFVHSVSTFKYSSTNAMVRVNFHFLKRNEKIDIYYGCGVGYAHTRVNLEEKLDGAVIDKEEQDYIDGFNKYLNDAFKIFPVAIEEVFGMKWAFTPNVGMYFEAGYSKAFCQLGVFAKIGSSKGYNRSTWKYY